MKTISSGDITQKIFTTHTKNAILKDKSHGPIHFLIGTSFLALEEKTEHFFYL